MAENKYLKAMQQANEHVGKPTAPIVPTTPQPAEQLPPRPRARTARSVGRPPGKRSNPDWEQITIFVRKDTKRAAMRRLMDSDQERDLSEIVEQLLARWSAKIT